jgi:hypothetical protein
MMTQEAQMLGTGGRIRYDDVGLVAAVGTCRHPEKRLSAHTLRRWFWR